MGKYRLVLKSAVTLSVCYFLFSRLEWDPLVRLWRKVYSPWFLGGMIFFNFSQIVSAWRLDAVVRRLRAAMTIGGQIRLYYLGMFYNFFLPGGVGGDGYKIYFWFHRFGISRRKLLGAILYDRISGLTALLFLAGLTIWFFPVEILDRLCQAIVSIALLGTALCWWSIHYIWLNTYKQVGGRVFFMGLVVQGLQVAAILCLAQALQVNAGIELAFLFLISSLAAAIPFTIGGIGARELVFFVAAPYINLESVTGVAIAMLFFLLILLSSSAGFYYHWFPNAITKTCFSSQR